MPVQQFLISNFKTGFDQELEPWLLMQDAFVELNNYRTQRGVVKCRRGITGFAQGGRSTAKNEQSRIYTVTTGEAVTDTNQTFTHTLANVPVRPGSVTFSEDGGDTSTDNGTGGFPTSATGFSAGATIDYNTGVVSATWDSGAPVNPVVTYTAANGNPVMGIFNFITSTNTRNLVVCSTDEFNKYNATTNRFDVIAFNASSNAAKPTGNESDFFSATMYPDKTSAPRLIMVNDTVADGFYSYNGTNIRLFNNSAAADNPDFGDVAGSSWNGNLATGLHVFYFNERLVVIRPRTTATIYPQRICWTGINDGSGNGDDFNAPGAGFLDIASEHWITAATRLKNSIIIWTTESVYELTLTDDIDLPFRVKQIGDAEGRGAQAPFSGVTYFGEGAAVGHYGFVGTDGRDSFRIDKKLPLFTRDRMVGLPSTSSFNSFDLVTSGTILEDDQFWWLYPDINHVNDSTNNTNVIANNFVEESWSIYDLFLTRLGKFQQTNEIPWDDVDGDEKDSWAYWDTTQEIWDDFLDQKFVFFSLAGDENGFIYNLRKNSDQCASISAISQADGAVVTTEPDVFKVGDQVTISGVSGMTEINDASYEVTAVSGNTVTIGIDSREFTAYISGGVMCRWIKREMETKPFNPFVEQNKKCRLRRVHFFIDTDKTSMLLDLKSDRRETAYRVNTQIDDGSNEGLAKKKWTSLTVNQTANFHTLRIHQENGQANERLHAIILECEPVGRLYR